MSSLPDIVLKRIAVRFQNELAIAAPFDTGKLSSSIKAQSTSRGIVVFMVNYGMYVEFGTKNKSGTTRQRPNPFIRNTIQNKLPKIIIEEIQRYSENPQ